MELRKIHEAAQELRVSECVLRRWIAKGAIPYHRLGKQYYFTETDIDSFLSANFVPAKAVQNAS